MTDIEFSCPFCNTSLIIVKECAGKVICCPDCQRPIKVPGLMRVANVMSSGQGYIAPPPYPPTVPNCTMAYVALALVCLSLLTAGLLLLPGIICGHIALGQCDREPQMQGRSFAIAALVVGYILICVGVLALIGFMSFVSSLAK